VGFESSRVARRRLAALAATNERVKEALAPSSFPGLFPAEPEAAPLPVERVAAADQPASLVQQLDALAHDIVATPGAGGALLAAYAAQARALTMVVEAARRAEGAPLPAQVLVAAQNALVPPQALAGLTLL
jgi:hypothetical protein